MVSSKSSSKSEILFKLELLPPRFPIKDEAKLLACNEEDEDNADIEEELVVAVPGSPGQFL